MANVCSPEADLRRVWLLETKGNLRHRIEKLGCERSDVELTSVQRDLRSITPGENSRPDWAGGAFVYLTASHLEEIAELVNENDVVLQSKHILVSDGYVQLVKVALGADQEEGGREAFLRARAGAIKSEYLLNPLFLSRAERQRPVGVNSATHVPTVQRTFIEVKEVHAESSEFSFHSRQAASTGDLPHEPSLVMVDDLAVSSRQPRFRPALLQLPVQIMERRDVDLELLEFLTAPPSVQIQSPEMWVSAWRQVCLENEWLVMVDHETRGEGPYCTVCKKWAELSHLTSPKCKSNRRNLTVSPFLSTILTAEEQRVNKWLENRATMPHIEPVVEQCAETCAKPRLQFRTTPCAETAAMPLEQSLPQATSCVAAVRPVQHDADTCPTVGCLYRRGSRGSATHCCKRCECAYKKGVARLYADPVTGERWRKAHGPECTQHADRRVFVVAEARPPQAMRALPSQRSYYSREGPIVVLNFSCWQGLRCFLCSCFGGSSRAASVSVSSSDNLQLGAEARHYYDRKHRTVN